MKTKKALKVLIALDYGPTAQKVAETGYVLAKTLGAEVILLHVILDLSHYSSSYLNMGPLQLDSAVELKDVFLKFLDKIRLHLGDEIIKTQVVEGDFADSILEAAKKRHVNIIVMGSHSHKWLESIVMGSVTEKVLNHTFIPLFIVPTKKQK